MPTLINIRMFGSQGNEDRFMCKMCVGTRKKKKSGGGGGGGRGRMITIYMQGERQTKREQRLKHQPVNTTSQAQNGKKVVNMAQPQQNDKRVCNLLRHVINPPPDQTIYNFSSHLNPAVLTIYTIVFMCSHASRCFLCADMVKSQSFLKRFSPRVYRSITSSPIG